MPQRGAVSFNGDSDHNGSTKNDRHSSEQQNGYHTPHRKVFDNEEFQPNNTEEVDENIIRLYF